MVYTGETECTYALQHLRRHQRNPPHLFLHWIHTNHKGTWTLRSHRTPTNWTSLKQSDKATANQEGTWLVQRLQVQLLVSSIFVHVAKNLYLTIKETLRQRTELVRVIHLCFILFYLRKKDVDIILLWARESVGTVRAWKLYMTSVYDTPCFSSSSSD